MAATIDFEKRYRQTILTGDLADRISLLIEFGCICQICGELISQTPQLNTSACSVCQDTVAQERAT